MAVEFLAKALWRSRFVSAAALVASLAACEVGPDYKRPAAEVPPAYKESQGWKIGEPQQAGSDQAWWSIYNDAPLDELEKQIDISNQNLKSSEAAYRQAVALVGEARANFFPTLTLGASVQRAQQQSHVQTLYAGSVGASWEIDIWGRIRREVESTWANAQASAADLAAARLSAQAALAAGYFDLRVEDELKRLLDATVVAFAHSLQITQTKYDAGVAAETDVASARTQLESTRAQAINVGVLRSQLEHAIAVLTGKPPADFTLAPAPVVVADVPVTPPGLPSGLLERRPDIAAAERQMAAANAQIGVAVAAYYPNISLGATGGFESGAITTLLSGPSVLWSAGPSALLTVFDVGRRRAASDQAIAAYDQTVANYRQTVLTGFQQVEDNVAALRILEHEAQVQDKAVVAAQKYLELAVTRYKGGVTSYLEVTTAESAALSDEVTAVNLLGRRMVAAVTLVQALGGGWDRSALPERPECCGKLTSAAK